MESELRNLKAKSEELAASTSNPNEKQVLRTAVLMLESQLTGQLREIRDRRTLRQVQYKGRDGCSAVISTYAEELARMETWLNDVTITHAGEPQSSYGSNGLVKMAEDHQVLCKYFNTK